MQIAADLFDDFLTHARTLQRECGKQGVVANHVDGARDSSGRLVHRNERFARKQSRRVTTGHPHSANDVCGGILHVER
jgi:hypothetical protein